MIPYFSIKAKIDVKAIKGFEFCFSILNNHCTSRTTSHVFFWILILIHVNLFSQSFFSSTTIFIYINPDEVIIAADSKSITTIIKQERTVCKIIEVGNHCFVASGTVENIDKSYSLYQIAADVGRKYKGIMMFGKINAIQWVEYRDITIRENKSSFINELIEMQITATPETVGFPVDILHITPDSVNWIQKKKQCE